ncbi:hypothetical protein DP939_06480 [Spongiactinospora rosea]|uniref:Uncharacterized protein n=1 Tax=Spongiactinospora rosea TaxID=2248750 RepID=A0A366M4G9_9ACTN|nr:hypothetical protein [Spongiactinospora rosea]RBQ20723.1 hypothetical protein DP939_06480 [Spongiactinospora rosea]
MDAFMLPYAAVRPASPAPPSPRETAGSLKKALAAHGISADLIEDMDRVQLSLCHGLIAVVQDDGIWWHSPRHLPPGIPLCVHRGTVQGAAEALAIDYLLLNPPRPVEEPHEAPSA